MPMYPYPALSNRFTQRQECDLQGLRLRRNRPLPYSSTKYRRLQSVRPVGANLCFGMTSPTHLPIAEETGSKLKAFRVSRHTPVSLFGANCLLLLARICRCARAHRLDESDAPMRWRSQESSSGAPESINIGGVLVSRSMRLSGPSLRADFAALCSRAHCPLEHDVECSRRMVRRHMRAEDKQEEAYLLPYTIASRHGTTPLSPSSSSTLTTATATASTCGFSDDSASFVC